MRSLRTQGFTLIELLIVVAIIAILAAIAVPNFLEAQTRAKASRMKADMRSAATAVEAYYIDWNQAPPPWDPGYAATYSWGTFSEPPYHSRLGSVLTTPTAYITTVPPDVFLDQTTFLSTGAWGDEAAMNLSERVAYWNFNYFDAAGLSSMIYMAGKQTSGAWLMYSAGPDRDVSNGGGSGSFYRPYDATNGTISLGNIFRTQRTPDGIDYLTFIEVSGL